MMQDDISIEIQRKNIKNIYIRIRRDKTVLVTAPLSCSQSFIEDFISRKESWLREHLAQMNDVKTYRYTSGEMHFYLGQSVTLRFFSGERNSGSIGNNRVDLFLHSSKTDRKKLYESVMKEALLSVVKELVAAWTPKMQVQPGEIAVRKMKSRWGTCHVRTGELCFALDLVTKPIECIEAVVVHEMNHLLEKGHTPRFHALMAHWLPDYKEREKRLNLWPKEFV